ncbi:hypothetical protein ACFV3R_27505 [Streptomyces sp. NPDC059740]|uniref:hypothetical protein n=1 Tax=Streptomyces sp. NPDC059740 TaxID=3346926 RepID=UPI00365B2694
MAHGDFSQTTDGGGAERASHTHEDGGAPGPALRRERRQALSSVITGGVLLVAGLVLLLVITPQNAAVERDFAAARPCAARSDSSECLRTVPAAVRHVTKVVSRSTRYSLTLAPAGGAEWHVKMAGIGGLAAQVSVGDEVRATLWRGEVRFVSFGELRQDTTDNPKGAHRPWEAVGLGTTLLSLGFLWGAYWLWRRASDSPAGSPWQIAVPMGGTLVLAGVGGLASLLAPSAWGAVVVVAVAAVPVAVVCAVLIRVKRRQTTDTIEVAARVPEGERCFAGSLRGGVPYEVPGYDYLVVGPGRFATTADPTGVFACREVPGTLVPVRVRPFYRTDPWPGLSHEFVVVECRDGETPVLVAVGRRNADVVLGALESAHSAHLARGADAADGPVPGALGDRCVVQRGR